MAEYIERTETVVLAMNAGARAIENTKRYHGAVYTKDVFSDHPQEIPYLQAAKVLREVSDAPTADVAPVVRCKDCMHACPAVHPEYVVCDIMECCRGLYKDDFCSCGERKDGDG